MKRRSLTRRAILPAAAVAFAPHGQAAQPTPVAIAFARWRDIHQQLQHAERQPEPGSRDAGRLLKALDLQAALLATQPARSAEDVMLKYAVLDAAFDFTDWAPWELALRASVQRDCVALMPALGQVMGGGTMPA